MPNADVQEAIHAIHKDRNTFRLAICVPSGDTWKAHMGVSLAVMGMELARVRIPPYSRQQFAVLSVQTSLITQSRHTLVEKALTQYQATHILFVDSDQTFPPNTVHRLIAHRKDVVGANIVTRNIPMVPCATALSGEKLWTRPESKGLEKVGSLGTGLMLLSTKVFAKIDMPFFESVYVPKISQYLGEDVYFSRKLREAGFDLWVDHDVSKEIGHIGSFDYNFPVAWEQGDLPGAMKEVA